MRQHGTIRGQRKLIEDLKNRQRNTIWPGPLANNRAVDAFLWKGSPSPSWVQRIAATIIGLFFICCAIAFAGMAAERHSILGFLGFAWLYIGARILRNSLPRRSRKGVSEADAEIEKRGR